MGKNRRASSGGNAQDLIAIRNGALASGLAQDVQGYNVLGWEQTCSGLSLSRARLCEMTGPHLFLELDLSDPTHRDLAGLGHRLDTLLNKPRVLTDDDFAGTLDEFLGALYALVLARAQGFVDRKPGTPIEIPVLRIRSAQIASGRARIDGKWMAGFYFNSALLRLAVVYHRGLKILTGSGDYVGPLLKKLDPIYRGWMRHSWSNTNIHRLHEEVNDLKHTPHGLYRGRNVTYQQAVAAVDELLKLFEAWPDLQ